jgi:lipid-A-disaccharide synthase
MPMKAERDSMRLPVPSAGPVDLLIVAAEHSGDEHAARMVRGVKARRPGLVVAALGGPKLEAAGAQLLRDLTASSAIGPGEVLKKISFFRALIAEIVRWIGEHRPRAVCFVDSSTLNLRIAQTLFARGLSVKAGGATKTLYLISPQIWASRAGRRFAMAEHLDGLAVIFPFEPACYADTKLNVEFIGHPFVADDHIAPLSYDPAGPVLLLPGSRRSSVGRIFPAILGGFLESGVKRDAVVLYPSEEILATLRAANPPANVALRRIGEMGTSPVAASAVLTSSGTMSLQCALAGIPGAVVYRTDWVTYWIGRWLVKVPYLGIANLLLKEPMYPEYIQGAATPEALAGELKACVEDPVRRERTAALAGHLRALLRKPASGTAADWVLRRLDA